MLEDRMTRRQRIVRRRIIIRGTLVLMTPTHLGDGDSEGATDMALVRDARDPKLALLTGASIAGALRNYVREYQAGAFAEEQFDDDVLKKQLAELLFGGIKASDNGSQSPLIINDALAIPSAYELRDGVKIDATTRTPAEKTKYDLELLAAGTAFPLQFELALADLVSDDNRHLSQTSPQTQQVYEQRLIAALALALDGLAHGEIALGMKKRRGFGRCKVERWEVWDFDLTNPRELTQWIRFERGTSSVARIGDDIRTLLPSTEHPPDDARARLSLTATFGLEGSILIRSGHAEAVLGPDVVHLHARQVSGESKPVIAGTSLAGVLRHRAERIANTLVPGSGQGFANHLFGRVGNSRRRTGDSGQASRLIIHESVIDHAETTLVQNRVGIDRFTGGALDGALYNAQPAFARPDTRIELRIDLINPTDVEKGLLLLLLKDLWTSDLPVGGESSIGRGRLRGITARIHDNGAVLAELDAEHPSLLKVGERETLNQLVAALPTKLRAHLEVHDEAA